MDDVLYIVDQPALLELCTHLQDAAWLALDTEFIREQTYYPQLCLVQIASATQIACIDPLAVPSLHPLRTLLQQPTTTKVFHAARQDLEVLHQQGITVTAPIFDTQVAAEVLGQDQQISYARLVEAMLGVHLDKNHTRVNWQQRPLAAAWLAYAADDVRYLRDIYRQQQQRLLATDKLELLQQRCAVLAQPENYQPQPARAWRRVRDYQHLRGTQVTVLQALAAWREEQAMREDRPRRWVLSDALLCELARAQPRTMGELGQLRGVPQRYAAPLLASIAAASS